MSLVGVGVRLTSLHDGVSLTTSCFGILATAFLTPWWLLIIPPVDVGCGGGDHRIAFGI